MPLFSHKPIPAIPRVGQRLKCIREAHEYEKHPLNRIDTYTVRQVFVYVHGTGLWDMVELVEKPGVIYSAFRFEAV